MWETQEMGNEDFLWAVTNFMGGIGGVQQAPCGAVSAAAVALGLQNRCASAEKERAKQGRNIARRDASEFVRNFTDRFGTIICRDLVGLDFTKPEEYKKFRESGIWKDRCEKYVTFTIEKLYEFDEKKQAAEGETAGG